MAKLSVDIGAHSKIVISIRRENVTRKGRYDSRVVIGVARGA